MATETGRRNPILMLRLPDRRDQAPFAVRANLKLQAVPRRRHTSRHLLLRPRADNSSQLLIYPIPILRFQSLNLLSTTTQPMPTFARASLIGKVLKLGRAWSAQGQRIFGAANDKMFCFRVCCMWMHEGGWNQGLTTLPIVRPFCIIISCYYDLYVLLRRWYYYPLTIVATNTIPLDGLSRSALCISLLP